MSQIETFLENAAQSRAEAEASSLANVKERCQRAESAWIAMAERAQHIEHLRAERETEAAQRKAAEVE